jgi:hypothetical protein
MHIPVMVRLTYIPARPLAAGVRTTNPHVQLHIDSQHADHTRKITTENMRQIDAAGGHRAQEHARWWRLRLRVRPGDRYGRE